MLSGSTKIFFPCSSNKFLFQFCNSKAITSGTSNIDPSSHTDTEMPRSPVLNSAIIVVGLCTLNNIAASLLKRLLHWHSKDKRHFMTATARQLMLTTANQWPMPTVRGRGYVFRLSVRSFKVARSQRFIFRKESRPNRKIESLRMKNNWFAE